MEKQDTISISRNLELGAQITEPQQILKAAKEHRCLALKFYGGFAGGYQIKPAAIFANWQYRQLQECITAGRFFETKHKQDKQPK